MRSSKIIIGSFVATLAVGGIVSAWTPPTGTPPAGNVTAPVNTGGVDQSKPATLTANNLGVTGGNILLTGASGNYINFDYNIGSPTAGNAGYGIMADGSGVLWAKNKGGVWTKIISGSGNNQWTTSGNNIYNNNTGNVGIKTPSPGEPLDVSGIIRSNSEIVSTLASGSGQFRMIGGSYGAFWRNDGTNTYLLFTNSGNQYGTWNTLRPFYVNDSNGSVTMGQNLGTAGRSPTTGYPSGWGGGLHTYDVYSEGTVGAGPSGGPVAAYLNSSGNIGASTVYTGTLCLGNDCRSAWPSGGWTNGSGSINVGGVTFYVRYLVQCYDYTTWPTAFGWEVTTVETSPSCPSFGGTVTSLSNWHYILTN